MHTHVRTTNQDATNNALQAKLQVCSGALLSGAAQPKEKEVSATILLNSDDSDAFSEGIRMLLQSPALMASYGAQLDEAAARTSHLRRIVLTDMKFETELPQSLEDLLWNAEYFSLKGNSFANLQEGSLRHYLYCAMTNLKDQTEPQLECKDLTGICSMSPQLDLQ
jgi:hypothetical protein